MCAYKRLPFTSHPHRPAITNIHHSVHCLTVILCLYLQELIIHGISIKCRILLNYSTLFLRIYYTKHSNDIIILVRITNGTVIPVHNTNMLRKKNANKLKLVLHKTKELADPLQGPMCASTPQSRQPARTSVQMERESWPPSTRWSPPQNRFINPPLV